MAAELIVKLYEYSPLFYISLISICFILTVALVLSWFGFDVPVIVRSSDEGDSLPPAPEKKMVQVLNPFSLELGPIPGTVRDGVCLRPYCLQECVLSCFWGCNIHALQVTLNQHRYGTTLNTAASFHRALLGNFLHHHTFIVGKGQRAEFVTQIPPDVGVSDFGLLPRDRYPLVAVLTLSSEEDQEAYGIGASVTVLHVPDEKYRLSERILFHYLLTGTGNVYNLKPLYMSTDSPSPAPTPEEPEAEWSGARGRDCVVCQNAAVNRVLLPCRHACVCDECVSYFQHCPICRAFVCESFALSAQTSAGPGDASATLQ